MASTIAGNPDSRAGLPSVGSRVQDCRTEDRGIVLFVGEVDGSSGVWVGVDWDNPSRGKHDGCHNGKSYFTARYIYFYV